MELYLQFFLLNVIATNFVGALHCLVHRHSFEAELQFALGDARHIEQVVDEPRLQFDVSPDDFQSVSRFR